MANVACVLSATEKRESRCQYFAGPTKSLRHRHGLANLLLNDFQDLPQFHLTISITANVKKKQKRLRPHLIPPPYLQYAQLT